MLTEIEIAACRSGLQLGDEAIEWITGFHRDQADQMAPAVLVGESPGPRSNPDLPIWPGPKGTTGDRLRHLVGLSRDTYLAFLERRNLVHGHVDHWPAESAAAAAGGVVTAAKGRPMILLGARVARAVAASVGLDHTPEPFEWFMAGTSDAVRIPHPSGVCRSYNDPDIRRRAALAIRDAFERSLQHVHLRSHAHSKPTKLGAPAARSGS